MLLLAHELILASSSYFSHYIMSILHVFPSESGRVVVIVVMVAVAPKPQTVDAIDNGWAGYRNLTPQTLAWLVLSQAFLDPWGQ